jgi:hypothetical protein
MSRSVPLAGEGGAPPEAVIGLRPALLRLDARLRRTVEDSRQELTRRARDPLRGLCITEADVDELLAAPPTVTDPSPSVLSSITEPRLSRLARWYGLDPFEQEALLICLAPDLDLRYERLYAYLQDDVTRRRPTVDLILRLLTSLWEERIRLRPALGPSGRLLRHGLLTVSDENAGRWPLLARPLRVDERIADFLLGSDTPDARLEPWTDLYLPHRDKESGAESPAVEQLTVLLSDGPSDAPRAFLLYLQAPPGAAKVAAIRSACAAVARPLLVLDAATLLATGNAIALLPLIVREGMLQDAVLCFSGFDALLGGEGDAKATGVLVRRQLDEYPMPVVLLGEARWEPATWWPERNAVRIEVQAQGPIARLQLWRRYLDGMLGESDLADLAARYRLDDQGVTAVVSAAQGRAAGRHNGPLDRDDIRVAARVIASPPLHGLAHRVEPRYGWDDIVLPADGLAQLHELRDRVQYRSTIMRDWGFGKKHLRRRGLVALFAGLPGTGKTMAAEVLAHALDLDLYRIDLSAVVSKYIGETEKNLDQIFRAADQGDAVLLFDEADALFGKRSEVRDAHDRYANVETAYLLQRLETYDGLAVLTTNMRGNIDAAFLRRLDCVLEFNMPEEAERLTIWRRSLPAEAPIAADVDLTFLARKFKLAGGHIHNIATSAAFLAVAEHEPIAMQHLIRGVRREYQKLGKLVAEADFEQYFDQLNSARSARGVPGTRSI